MIFSSCTGCGEMLTCFYEDGDETGGMFERVVCESCEAENFIEHISFDGRTMSRQEADSLGLIKITKAGEDTT